MSSAPIELPVDCDNAVVAIRDREVRLTNLRKAFWTERGIVKRDLLQYYATVAPALLPHVVDRAMVMKRYPNGAAGECFFMKRAPEPRPPWIETCSITHGSGNVIAFPIVQDVASLLWLVNLGCIDLNPWYARCDDVDRPDFLHFDLDPVPPATFEAVRATALAVRDALTALGMPAHVKTTGSKGVHVYVPIVRGPTQKEVWTFAKQFAFALAAHYPDLMTAEYRIAKRPAGRVLVDYNQNAWDARSRPSIRRDRHRSRRYRRPSHGMSSNVARRSPIFASTMFPRGSQRWVICGHLCPIGASASISHPCSRPRRVLAPHPDDIRTSARL